MGINVIKRLISLISIGIKQETQKEYKEGFELVTVWDDKMEQRKVYKGVDGYYYKEV